MDITLYDNILFYRLRVNTMLLLLIFSILKLFFLAFNKEC